MSFHIDIGSFNHVEAENCSSEGGGHVVPWLQPKSNSALTLGYLTYIHDSFFTEFGSARDKSFALQLHIAKIFGTECICNTQHSIWSKTCSVF